jgi:DNA-binding GntR family transcriptional regulator
MPIRVARRRNSSSPPSVYERLKQLILDQKVAPGAPLPEEELARTFGVSRTPIHEALVRLEKDRLVVLQPWRGAFVRGMTMDDVRELYQIREAVEGMAARLAAEMIGEEPLNQLGKNCVQLVALGKNGDPSAFFETAREFHWILFRGVSNQRVREILSNIREQLGAVRKYLVNNPEKVAADLQDHPMILDAIRRHDPEEAEQLMRRHIRAMRAALLGALK